jgi:hypothetical protein
LTLYRLLRFDSKVMREFCADPAGFVEAVVEE